MPGARSRQPSYPFIGRLVGEKAADLCPKPSGQSIYQHHGKANFLVLGSGESQLEDQLDHEAPVQRLLQLLYRLQRTLGATRILRSLRLSADAQPGRTCVSTRCMPCAGTVPMVRSGGGLKDTIRDFW